MRSTECPSSVCSLNSDRAVLSHGVERVESAGRQRDAHDATDIKSL